MTGEDDVADEADVAGEAGGSPLPDGTYDAFVIDVEGTTYELTLVSGEHKGEVVRVASSAALADPTDAIGMPATLTVEDGRPRVRLDG